LSEEKTEAMIVSEYPFDNGGRRAGIDRRSYSYDVHFPERRQGLERRRGADRRSGEDRRAVIRTRP